MSNPGVTQVIPIERVERLIHLARGEKVLLDADLAKLYGVTTGNLNKAVKRNQHRFPPDFMFQLTDDEADVLIFQTGISKQRGGRRHNPYAFTEQGVAMLCLGQNPYSLDALRVAAQFLSSPRINAARLCRLAVQERCEPVLLHIAEVAQKYVPEQEPWGTLRNQLHPRHVRRTDALPHWTRLVSHTGVTANGGSSRTDWLCRLD